MRFQIGDRIEAVVDHIDGHGLLMTGDQGVIVYILPTGRLKVRWDRYIRGHDCGGLCDNGYGWNVQPEDVVLVNVVDCSVDVSDFL